MFAWRSLLYSSVRSLMSCCALSVAFFIATMRALCSLAFASSKIWCIWKFRLCGSKFASTVSSSGSNSKTSVGCCRRQFLRRRIHARRRP
jgi:hypothetical protein